jgi:hypothetical protein
MGYNSAFKGLNLNLLTTTIFAPPSNASKWQMGFNSAFKGLNGLSEEKSNLRERTKITKDRNNDIERQDIVANLSKESSRTLCTQNCKLLFG